jgi:hypothetical protein
VKQIGEAGQRRNRTHLDALHERRLRGVPLRDEEAPVAGAASSQRRVQRSADRTELTAERQLARERVLIELVGGDLSARGQQPHRDGEVEARARLPDVGGREVHRQPLLREVELGVEERRPHALARLADRPVRQPDEGERRKPAPDVDLDGDLLRPNPLQRERGDRGEHRPGR